MPFSIQQNTSAYAVLGGTFSPIHYGHLHLALAVKKLLTIPVVHLMPCYLPVHRNTPSASSSHRLKMLKIAIESDEQFAGSLAIDDREIKRNTPSYTIDSLRELRDSLGTETPIFFIMGLDSFSSLKTWHEWEEFLNLVNIVVSYRPDNTLYTNANACSNLSKDAILSAVPDTIAAYYKQHCAPNLESFTSSTCGYILLDDISNLDISSSIIRHNLTRDVTVDSLIPPAIVDYIKKERLYS